MPLVVPEWLGEHVDLPAGLTIEALAEALVKVGIEEETIHGAAVTGPLVVGKVLAVTPEAQKNGKTINWCLVDVGTAHNTREIVGVSEADLQAAGAPDTGARGIVCGAHNFKAGDFVVVALPGTVLPGPFPIAARKTYGHISDGMICSQAELGFPDDGSHGIIVLPNDGSVRPGRNAIDLFGLGTEVLEINITPDRGYQLSYRGIGREYALSTGAKFKDPAAWGNSGGHEAGLSEIHETAPTITDDAFPVIISDAAPIHGAVGCDRFVTRIVRNIDPKAPTPDWMVKRLEASGMRSISLPVDITNYVMLDLGQPIHAYDLDKVAAPIVVRRANSLARRLSGVPYGLAGHATESAETEAPGETLKTLDDIERKLADEDLLITDSPDGVIGSRVLGLAGVMGGQSSEITDTTTAALIECAHFDPVSVARTARRHKLPSEAAKRFERGVDQALPPLAAQRVVDLLVAYGGGVADPAVGDLHTVVPPAPIKLPVGLPSKIVGVAYSRDRIIEVLELIGCHVTAGGGEDLTGADISGFSPDNDILQVTPPTWRPDLTEPVDLVEEIVRIDGYDQVPSILPAAPGSRGLTRRQRAQRSAARALAEAGLVETLSYPFVSETNVFTKPGALKLANPLADDRPHLRTDLLATLLETAGRNVSRGMSDFGLFEQGAVTDPPVNTHAAPVPPIAARPDEATLNDIHAVVPPQPTKIAGVLVGSVQPSGWWGKGRTATWRDALELVALIVARVGAEVTLKRPSQPSVEDDSVRLETTAHSPSVEEDSVRLRTTAYQWHPGRSAELFDAATQKNVGIAGELHPKVCAAYGLPARTVAFEVDLTALTGNAEPTVRANPISTYPAAKEDFAFVIGEEVPARTLESVISEAAGDLKEELVLFDVYTGEQLEPGKKSLAFSLKLRAPDRTLDPADVRQVRDTVIKNAEAIGAKLRA